MRGAEQYKDLFKVSQCDVFAHTLHSYQQIINTFYYPVGRGKLNLAGFHSCNILTD